MQRHPEQLDLRQRRTRRQLAQALAQLLEDGSPGPRPGSDRKPVFWRTD